MTAKNGGASLAVMSDMTENLPMSSLPNSSLAELLSFLDSLPSPRIVMDGDYRIVGANRAYRREFGGGQSILGRCCYEVSHHFTVPCDQAGESCPLKLAQEEGDTRRVLHLHHTSRGEEHVDVEITPIRDEQGALRYFVESFQVVRQAAQQRHAQGLVGRSPAFLRLLERLMRVAAAESAVLILGATGTGKELVAQTLHEASPRRHGPFVAVDCAGLTETLFESELFGYEKGAFTGANFRKLGLVEAASGGTLFLDEIGELPLTLQVKLLRLLESGTYRRVGGLDSLRADFRLVAATHRDLPAMVRGGSFRQDLFYRLNVFPLRTPSLAERREDIPMLAASLLERVDSRPGRRLAPEALAWLQGRDYAGNIRELRNLVERAALLGDGQVISLENCLDGLDEGESGCPALPALGAASGNDFSLTEPLALAEVERRYLAWLQAHWGETKPSALAARLGISERTLYRKLQPLRHPGSGEGPEES